MKVGIKIKAYLESKGISQEFLSKKSGIALAKLNLVLNGKRGLTISEYETICWVHDHALNSQKLQIVTKCKTEKTVEIQGFLQHYQKQE